MTRTSKEKSLELSVCDFGPIAGASIKLRPMSVFVGPSNTGKSCMAALIYALHKFFKDHFSSGNYEYRSIRHGLFVTGGIWMIPTQGFKLSESEVEGLYCWARKENEHIEPPSSELPEVIAKLVRVTLSGFARLSEDLDDEITRCFGVNKVRSLIRHPGGGRTTLALRGSASRETERENPFEYNVAVTDRGVKADASIPGTLSSRMDWNNSLIRHFPWHLVDHSRVGSEEKREIAIALLGAIASDIVIDTVGSLTRPAHYLPADRAGVMHAHQVAVRGLIAGGSRIRPQRDSAIPVLSGVLGDFMEQLVALAHPSRRAQDENYDDLAHSLEQTLLGGAVRAEQSPINYPSFAFRPSGWKRDLPLMNTSSMVSELAPVVLYLRHVVQPGDLLIIEEPESHLHPAMQVKFIRQLATAVQSGIRILITTHSEWVLEELANLVRLSELPEDRRAGIEDGDVALSPDQIGAWSFEPNPEEDGSTVREIALDTESATFPAGFGLVTESLYNRWSEISTRIEEG